jgi:hypothetical protein
VNVARAGCFFVKKEPACYILSYSVNLNIMQTVYRLKAQEISMAFLKSLKTLFAGKEVIITVESVDEKRITNLSGDQSNMLHMVTENRRNAPVIGPDIDIRQLIDEAQHPGE